MNIDFMNPDLWGGIIGFLLTLCVFSYIFGDNFLFRLAIYLFIGVSAGLALVVVFYNVILNQLVFPLIGDPLGSLALIPPLILGLWLLLTKFSPRLSGLGSPVMAFLVGVGAATAIGGVVVGTLFPQMSATTSLFAVRNAPPGIGGLLAYLIRGVLVLVGTLATLIFFHFGGRPRADQVVQRPAWMEIVAGVGQYFILITFAVLFAGVYAAALTALIERVNTVFLLFIDLLGDFILV